MSASKTLGDPQMAVKKRLDDPGILGTEPGRRLCMGCGTKAQGAGLSGLKDI